MTDPFFSTGKNPEKKAENSVPQQLDAVGQTPASTGEKKSQNSAESSRQNSSQTSPQNSGQKIPPKTGAVKKNTFSLKTVLIGCGIFFVVFLGILAFFFAMFARNPDQIAAIGLDRAVVTQILQIFAILFFLLLFFAGFGMLIVNGYKIITVKNQPKLRFGIQSFVGFLLVMVSLGLGIAVFQRLQQFAGGQQQVSNSFVVPMIQDGAELRPLGAETLVAPVGLQFRLNSEVFQRNFVANLPANFELRGLRVNCGNGQSLPIVDGTLEFAGICDFAEAGSFALAVEAELFNRQTLEDGVERLDAGNLVIPSAVEISRVFGEWRFSNGEVQLGEIPARFRVDARPIFRDLGLENYEIFWDLGDDDRVDLEGDPIFRGFLTGAGVLDLQFRSPESPQLLGQFALRVEPSDLPVCGLDVRAVAQDRVELVPNFWGPRPAIRQGNAVVTEFGSERVVARGRFVDESFAVEFVDGGEFVAVLNFLTADGREAACRSDIFVVTGSNLEIQADFFAKSFVSPEFLPLPVEGFVTQENWEILITQSPTILQLRTRGLQPNVDVARWRVRFDGTQILPSGENVFEVRAGNSAESVIEITALDADGKVLATERVSVRAQNPDFTGKILLIPDSVGQDPFRVTLDASTVRLFDKNDEIVSYSRRFGDGQEIKNSNSAVQEYEYRYNIEDENGEFRPSVEVSTKLGQKFVVEVDRPVIVKKRSEDLEIRSDSHPSQISRVGERVKFFVDLTGLPERVERDFGDGETFRCEGRQCLEISHSFAAAGTRTVEVRAVYPDGIRSVGRLNFQVR